MKVALVHDYIKEYGGAERVLEALHGIWPESTVFTSVYLPQFLGPHKERFAGWNIVTSSFQKIPFIHKLISPLRLFSAIIFENFDFSDYDLVIVSATGAYLPNFIVRQPETVHICYCHTPPRYLYGYPTARNWKKNKVGKIIGEFFNHSLRHSDFVAAQRPDYFIANSNETKKRIEKFYRREATVIYPPVTTYSSSERSESRSSRQARTIRVNYYLAGGRLARAKGIDIAISACNKLGLPLKVFGKAFAGYEEELKALAGPTIEFLGEVSEEELAELYKGAKALIYPSQYEDFGIIPVEAQSYGTPVIALAQGGVLETVIEGKTGVFFPELTVESLVKAIKSFDLPRRQAGKLRIKEEDCIKNAKRFSKERFKKEIKDFVMYKIKS